MPECGSVFLLFVFGFFYFYLAQFSAAADTVFRVVVQGVSQVMGIIVGITPNAKDKALLRPDDRKGWFGNVVTPINLIPALVRVTDEDRSKTLSTTARP